MYSDLPTDSINVSAINSGDIMLYGSDCVVLFYKSFSTTYSYTKIGYVENLSGIADTAGRDNITISFYK